MMPIGMLIKKTQCHEAISINQPPRIGPMMGPSSIGMPSTAMTEPTRSGPAARVMIIMPMGMSRPPPKPWITRNATSDPMFQARAHRIEPMRNRTSDAM